MIDEVQPQTKEELFWEMRGDIKVILTQQTNISNTINSLSGTVRDLEKSRLEYPPEKLFPKLEKDISELKQTVEDLKVLVNQTLDRLKLTYLAITGVAASVSVAITWLINSFRIWSK